jgi:hypothetical protein
MTEESYEYYWEKIRPKRRNPPEPDASKPNSDEDERARARLIRSRQVRNSDLHTTLTSSSSTPNQGHQSLVNLVNAFDVLGISTDVQLNVGSNTHILSIIIEDQVVCLEVSNGHVSVSTYSA